VSIASKKSVKAFVVSAFGVSFGGALSGTVGAGVDDASGEHHVSALPSDGPS
jgi:hypothetical protein